MIQHVVRLIRKHYSPDIPIIFRMDFGFCDQKVFEEMECFGVGYLRGDIPQGYQGIRRIAAEHASIHHFGKKDEDIWQYCGIGNLRSAWNIFRRAVFWRTLEEEKQFSLSGSKPGTLPTPTSA